jgi:hypothetical protein
MKLSLPELEELLRTRTHVESCPVCKESLALFDSTEELWEQAAKESSAPSRPSFTTWFSLPKLMLASSIAVLLLAVFIWQPWIQPDGKEGILRPKGSFQLLVAAERLGKTFRVTPGMQLETGDQLGFFYTSAEAGHLMILYADQPGEVVRLFPSKNPKSAGIQPGRRVPLDDGARLSKGQGCEWVIAVFSDSKFDEEMANNIVERMLAKQKDCKLNIRQITRSKEYSGLTIQTIEVRR